VHEADGVELLVAGEAAAGLAGDDAGGIVHAIGEAALAPGVVGEPSGRRLGSKLDTITANGILDKACNK
jgi:hypothetical protein